MDPKMGAKSDVAARREAVCRILEINEVELAIVENRHFTAMRNIYRQMSEMRMKKMDENDPLGVEIKATLARFKKEIESERKREVMKSPVKSDNRRDEGKMNEVIHSIAHPVQTKKRPREQLKTAPFTGNLANDKREKFVAQFVRVVQRPKVQNIAKNGKEEPDVITIDEEDDSSVARTLASIPPGIQSWKNQMAKKERSKMNGERQMTSAPTTKTLLLSNEQVKMMVESRKRTIRNETRPRIRGFNVDVADILKDITVDDINDFFAAPVNGENGRAEVMERVESHSSSTHLPPLSLTTVDRRPRPIVNTIGQDSRGLFITPPPSNQSIHSKMSHSPAIVTPIPLTADNDKMLAPPNTYFVFPLRHIDHSSFNDKPMPTLLALLNKEDSPPSTPSLPSTSSIPIQASTSVKWKEIQDQWDSTIPPSDRLSNGSWINDFDPFTTDSQSQDASVPSTSQESPPLSYYQEFPNDVHAVSPGIDDWMGLVHPFQPTLNQPPPSVSPPLAQPSHQSPQAIPSDSMEMDNVNQYLPHAEYFHI